MALSYTTSTSSSTLTDVSLSDGSSTSSLTYETQLQTSSPYDSGGLAASLGSDAVALGDDTLTSGDVSATVIDEGAVQSVTGTASALAAAQDDTSAFAAASTSGAIAGAEVSYTLTGASDTTYETPTGTTSLAASTTTLGADNVQSPSEWNDGVTDTSGPVTGTTPIDPLAINDASVHLEGNVATADFSGTAIADDSLVSVDAFALAVDGQLSISTVDLTLAVG